MAYILGHHYSLRYVFDVYAKVVSLFVLFPWGEGGGGGEGGGETLLHIITHCLRMRIFVVYLHCIYTQSHAI